MKQFAFFFQWPYPQGTVKYYNFSSHYQQWMSEPPVLLCILDWFSWGLHSIVLTCWHMRLKHIPHNPNFLAKTILLNTVWNRVGTCFVSVMCKITFGRFHATRWHLIERKKCVAQVVSDKRVLFGWRWQHAFLQCLACLQLTHAHHQIACNFKKPVALTLRNWLLFVERPTTSYHS